MKKTKSQPILSKRLRDAISKDLQDAYDEATYDSHDPHGTLETLQKLGVGAMPNTEAIIEALEKMEDSPTMLNYDRWGLSRPFGLSNLKDE